MKPAAAAGNHQVDVVVHLEHGHDQAAIGAGNDLDGVAGDAGGLDGVLNEAGEEAVGVDGLLAAAEDAGVAGLEAEGGDCRWWTLGRFS